MQAHQAGARGDLRLRLAPLQPVPLGESGEGVELAAELARQGIGEGRVDAFCSAMGSAGTIAAGDRLKQVWPDHKIVGLEPIQCPVWHPGTHHLRRGPGA